jgi:hypothetical protein
MAQTGCFGSYQLMAVRAHRLEADGSKICPNPDGSAYNLRPVRLQIDPQQTTGERAEQRAGDGTLCGIAENPDLTTGVNLTLELCQLDLELLELLTGGQIVLDAGDTIGYIGPDPTSPPDPVEFHAWSKSWAGSSQNASPHGYVHWVFPQVVWTIGGNTLENAHLVIQVTGKASANPNLGTGSMDDLPSANFGDSFIGWYLADDLPDSADSPYSQEGISCGYFDTPACGS